MIDLNYLDRSLTVYHELLLVQIHTFPARNVPSNSQKLNVLV